MISATSTISTTAGSRYLQQLCKHWSHNLAVEFTAERGRIVFPKDVRGADYPAEAIVTFAAEADVLHVMIDASSTEQLEALKAVVPATWTVSLFAKPRSFLTGMSDDPPSS